MIRGAPGVGKSETAKGLAKHFPKGAKVEVDTLRLMVNSVRWTDQAEHKQMLQVAAHVALDLVGYGFAPVIVVDTFSGDKIGPFLDTVERLKPGISFLLFGLYASEPMLQSRLESRPDSQFKDFAIARKLNADLRRVAHPAERQIDTTSLSRNQVVEMLVALLGANRPN